MLVTYLFYAYLAIVSLFAIVTTITELGNYKDHERKYTYTPKTLVIVPCKGVDYKMEENLSALKNQDYKNYDIVAVINSSNDSAVRCIRKVGIRFIVASKLGKGSGKVNAIANALTKFRNYEVYAIADSDTLMKRTWLTDLVKPLKDKRVGLSTSYPYFEGVSGFASKLKCAWSLTGEGMMESNLLRFAWGGSLAFKKKLLSKDELDYFKDSLSDDIALSRISKRRGLKTVYVKNAQPTVRATDTFPEFVEWSNRQTALSIFEDRKKLYIGLPYYALEFILLISAFALTIFYTYLAVLLFVPVVLKCAKTYQRLRDKSVILVILNLLMPAFYIGNLLAGSAMKSISWRGRRYEI